MLLVKQSLNLLLREKLNNELIIATQAIYKHLYVHCKYSTCVYAHCNYMCVLIANKQVPWYQMMILEASVDIPPDSQNPLVALCWDFIEKWK